jgi:RNA polymerase sigma factor (sigma-70 family)
VYEAALGSVAETTVEARLYEQHADLIYRYCLRALGSREDAEDATQTTFFQAVRAMRRGVEPAFEQAWLLTIAKNECRSRHRANGRRRQLELVRDPQTLAEVAEAPGGSDGTLIGVQEALGRLPEMQRRALLLREWQGRSYAEIATELGVTRPSVEALLFRARRGLARELGEEKRSRRHAFDLASLLGALKSALGGGAAVKVAAGVVAVATIGTVTGGSEQKPLGDRTTPVRAQPSPQVSMHSRSGPVVGPAASGDTVKSGSRRAGPPPGAESRPNRPGPGARAGITRPEPPTSSSPAGPPGAPTPTAPGAAPPAAEHAAAAPSVPGIVPPVQPPSAPPVPEPPAIEVPPIELPRVELPPIELPKVELPKVEVPGVELPKVEVPKIEVPKVELPKVETPKIEVPLPKVELPKLP